MITLPAEISARYPGAQAFRFGDSAALNAQILALVRAGTKTVTCAALAAFEAGGAPLPEVGRIDIALDWAGTPQLAIRTLELRHIAFDQMPENLVAAQGEFRDLAHWRQGYTAYLTRAGQFDPQVMMLVERFEVVADLAEGAAP